MAFQGVEATVPQDYLEGVNVCERPPGDFVVVGTIQRCQALNFPPNLSGLTIVRLSPDALPDRQDLVALATAPVTVDGVNAMRGTGTWQSTTPIAVLHVPSRGALVAVESADAALASEILDSVRLTGAASAGQ